MEVDFSRLDRATAQRVDEILRGDHELKVLEAVKRQTAIAKRNHDRRPRARDGFGERTFEVDAVVDTIWRQVYGHDYSEDQDLMRFLLKRNPEIGVRSAGTRVQVGYTASGRGKKYSRKF